MRRADRHVSKHPGRGDHRLAVNRERDFAFEDVEAFFLTAVDVRRWSTAWRHDCFKDGVFSIRVIPGCKETVNVADHGNGLALSGSSNGWVHVAGPAGNCGFGIKPRRRAFCSSPYCGPHLAIDLS